MKDKGKTKKQVSSILVELRQRIAELEKVEAERKRVLEQKFRMEGLREQIEELKRRLT